MGEVLKKPKIGRFRFSDPKKGLEKELKDPVSRKFIFGELGRRTDPSARVVIVECSSPASFGRMDTCPFFEASFFPFFIFKKGGLCVPENFPEPSQVPLCSFDPGWVPEKFPEHTAPLFENGKREKRRSKRRTRVISTETRRVRAFHYTYTSARIGSST